MTGVGRFGRVSRVCGGLANNLLVTGTRRYPFRRGINPV